MEIPFCNLRIQRLRNVISRASAPCKTRIFSFYWGTGSGDFGAFSKVDGTSCMYFSKFFDVDISFPGILYVHACVHTVTGLVRGRLSDKLAKVLGGHGADLKSSKRCTPFSISHATQIHPNSNSGFSVFSGTG